MANLGSPEASAAQPAHAADKRFRAELSHRHPPMAGSGT
jgi:hypothetical protein